MTELLTKKHQQFLTRCLRSKLPQPYQQEDAHRLTLLYFLLSAMDLLALPMPSDEQTDAKDWIYARQRATGGFCGSPATNETAHIINSYAAVLSLAILRDDWTRLDRNGLASFVKSCQKPDGSFSTYPGSLEVDVRSSYCALVLQHFLGRPIFDVDKTVGFVLSCETYDGSFGQAPGLEGNGGSTYCAVASLALANQLSKLSDRTLDWLVHRQTQPHPRFFMPEVGSEDEEETEGESKLQAAKRAASMAGEQGRAHKDVDSCYSFWIGAAIKILEPDLLQPNAQKEQAYLFACQHPIIGGLANQPGNPPDLYHTYISLAALSLSGLEGLQPLDPLINVSKRTLSHLL